MKVRRPVFCALLIGALAELVSTATPGYRALFDGKNKAGWEQAGQGTFSVDDGTLVQHGGMGLLWYTRKKFTNYDLHVVYKLTHDDDNSGVYIKIGPNKPEGRQGAWYGVHHGYEVQIDEKDDEYHRTGCIYSLVRCGANNKPVGEWNDMLIKVRGRTVDVIMNGQQVTHYVEGQPAPPRKHDYEPERHLRPLNGYIGIQNHGGNSRVVFKTVEIREVR